MDPSSNFEFLFSAVANGSIPVSKYRSKVTGISVFIGQVEGPLVNGYFCLATEAHDDDGLPHTLEHLVFMGSEHHPYKGVLDLLANRCLASGTNAWTDTDHTCYTMTNAGSEGFLKLLPIYIEHILYPTLKESGYITEVHHVNSEGEDAGVVYCEMQARENTGESLCHLNMLRAMYPGNCGYKSETGGIMANLRDSTSHVKVCNYHRDFYRPDNLCLVITGQVTPEQVFEALKPVEDMIKSKGDLPPFTRPWQSEVPPLESNVEQVIAYPSDDEKYGMVYIGWRGPKAKEQYRMLSLGVLMQYLSDSAIAPLQRELVEIADPYCSKIRDAMIENSESCVYFQFQNVPLDKLKLIHPKLVDILRNLATGNEPFDMKRMSNLIHRSMLETLNSVEDSPHDAMAFILLSDFLYGDNQEDLEMRVNSIANYKKMKLEPETYWREILEQYFVDKPTIVMIGEPSKELMASLGKAEKDRIAQQQKNLGESGLKELADALEKASDENDIEPPEDLVKSVSVPDVSKINFHPIKTAANFDTEKAKLIENFPLVDIPFKFQLDDIHTNFVKIFALLDSNSIPQALRYYLPLFCELVTESPVMRDGVLVSHEEVIAQLEADTLSADCSVGVHGSKFSCGQIPYLVTLSVKVEEEKYATGVNWLKELLFQTQFTAERISIIANRMTNDIAAFKRSGQMITRTIMRDIIFSRDSNHCVVSMLRQHKFLTDLAKKVEAEPTKVIEDLESLRKMLTATNNIRIHMSANVPKLTENTAPELPWKQFVHTGDGDNNQSLLKKKTCDEVLSYTDSVYKCAIVAVGSVESAYFIQVVPCISDFLHPDLPAVMVFIQYITQLEGPMWRQIRGLGLSYHYSMYVKPETGLLYFLLARSTHVVDAYKEGREIVMDFFNGTTKFTEIELESARSSLIFEIIDEEKTVSDTSLESLLAYLRGLDHKYNKYLLKKVANVTLADLKRVGSQYIAPLFDPSIFRCAAVVNPAKVDETVKEFKELKVNLHVISSLEDGPLCEL
ncbi:uncharacterized protein C05D11.1-like [Gigantopelta aegis]|uniref:uncharacterized protein C05D11.1-like n=1 Tax=Gigantopelta aegis TaxID=1735272 RepID=UPI001B88CEEF|nr:uncharacterized protein C05D11.1-like [Gigantopelta aegis]